jgi:hypothetical protein
VQMGTGRGTRYKLERQSQSNGIKVLT